jgi:hypothetical protein
MRIDSIKRTLWVWGSSTSYRRPLGRPYRLFIEGEVFPPDPITIWEAHLNRGGPGDYRAFQLILDGSPVSDSQKLTQRLRGGPCRLECRELDESLVISVDVDSAKLIMRLDLTDVENGERLRDKTWQIVSRDGALSFVAYIPDSTGRPSATVVNPDAQLESQLLTSLQATFDINAEVVT